MHTFRLRSPSEGYTHTPCVVLFSPQGPTYVPQTCPSIKSTKINKHPQMRSLVLCKKVFVPSAPPISVWNIKLCCESSVFPLLSLLIWRWLLNWRGWRSHNCFASCRRTGLVRCCFYCRLKVENNVVLNTIPAGDKGIIIYWLIKRTCGELKWYALM